MPCIGNAVLAIVPGKSPNFLIQKKEIKLFWGNERNQVSALKFPLKDIVFHVFFALLFCSSLFCKWFLIIHDFLRHVLDTACHHGRSEFKRGNCRVSPTPKLPPLNLSISDNKFVITERLLWYFVFCFEASSHFTVSLVAQAIKNLPAMQETWIQTSLDWEDPLEKGMETHSSIRAWRTPWTGESGVLQSPMELQKPDRTEQLSITFKLFTAVWLTKLIYTHHLPWRGSQHSQEAGRDGTCIRDRDLSSLSIGTHVAPNNLQFLLPI